VLRLDAVFVHHAAVRWQPRGQHELKELQSRQRMRANLSRGKAQANAAEARGDGLEAGETARRSSSTSGGGAVLGTAARPA
jgi:hypothetical protein